VLTLCLLLSVSSSTTEVKKIAVHITIEYCDQRQRYS